MELKEYLQIIKKYQKLYLVIILCVVVGAEAFFFFQPISYETSLTLNITREGTQDTADYRYDDFYRLQADERFSDTVAEWLRSPRIVNDIFLETKIDPKGNSLKKLSQSFSAQRKSSQIVAVKFSTNQAEVAEKVSSNLIKIISDKTQKLNETQKDPNWFKIVAEKPLTLKKSPDYAKIFLAALLAEIFFGFFVVMIKHYLE